MVVTSLSDRPSQNQENPVDRAQLSPISDSEEIGKESKLSSSYQTKQMEVLSNRQTSTTDSQPQINSAKQTSSSPSSNPGLMQCNSAAFHLALQNQLATMASGHLSGTFPNFIPPQLFPALFSHNPIQTEPLSLKMSNRAIPHSPSASGPSNPPSDGSSNGLGPTRLQPSPSTSSTSNPEATDAFHHSIKQEDHSSQDLDLMETSGCLGDNSMDDLCAGSDEGWASKNEPNNCQQSWSFEEQHKQLYEISDDPSRKEFLDELFSFWQTKGTPVTRVPIMAKQVLDLYELYRLVVAHGGLVEVINKKLWREITKGLNLPSSITSAAFTLRTQYQKYLYAYECEREKLSTPAELQAAIDGNRREGRRSGFAPYPSSAGLLAARHTMTAGTGSLLDGDDGKLAGVAPNGPLAMQHANMARAVAAMYRDMMTQQETMQMQQQSRKIGSAFHVTSQDSPTGITSSQGSRSLPPATACTNGFGDTPVSSDDGLPSTSESPPKNTAANNVVSTPVQRSNEDSMNNNTDLSLNAVQTSNISIRARGNQLVVHMDINGILYAGVLLEQSGSTSPGGQTSNTSAVPPR